MTRTILLPEELQEVIDRLDRIESTLQAKSKPCEEQFMDSQEFMQLMHISKKTCQIWRDTGIIPFSQIGHKIYYKVSDINTMMDKHYISTKR